MNSKSFSCLGVIPVRLESSRLPQKPLKDIHGQTLVERVWRQAKKCSQLHTVVVATNSPEIAEVCKTFSAQVVMTGSQHETGTDRVAEALTIIEKDHGSFDFVANIQGDMPFINPAVIDSVIQDLASVSDSFDMATIATPITDRNEFERTAAVKIALGENERALYFSRSPIPHWRNFPGEDAITPETPYGVKHMGLYIYKNETLKRLSKLPRAMTEQREALEQLRALAHGIAIKVNVLPRPMVEPAIEVDTPEDLEKAIQYARSTGT